MAKSTTSVLAWHPGGASAITAYAGKATAQATADYTAIHDAYAQKKTQEVLIGKLSELLRLTWTSSNSFPLT